MVLNALTHVALFLYNIDEKFAKFDEKFDKFDEKFDKFDEYFRQKTNF